MRDSDTADKDSLDSLQSGSEDFQTAPLTATRALVRACPPVTERETQIVSWFRKQFWHTALIHETDLSWRDLLAYPGYGLLHTQSKKKRLY